jgi:hypothetical protein
MLAPANHGSALAQLGKGRLSRMKFFAQGVQPGERVLDWLELGSPEAWALNESWIDQPWVSDGIFPFVLTGQTIDRSFYDALNSYTDEVAGDGVVRVAAANLNYSLLALAQNANQDLVTVNQRRTKACAMGILPKVAHSGEDIGIIRSVSAAGTRPEAAVRSLKLTSPDHPTAQWVLRCLGVANATDYDAVRLELESLTARVQQDEQFDKQRTVFGTRRYPNSRCTQVIVRIRDDRGDTLTDYDLFLTAGPRYSPDDLPPGFFVDRQRNSRSPGTLTYFLNWDVLNDAAKGLRHPKLEAKLGFRIVARPQMSEPETNDGMAQARLAGYRTLDFKSNLDVLAEHLRPNETLMVDIQLRRLVDAAVFRADKDLAPRQFKAEPENRLIP